MSPVSLTWRDVMRLAREGNPAPPRRVERSEAEWQAALSPEEFRVMRLAGTERAHTSALCTLFAPGRYACGCCATVLFDSATKFDSGTGWPSFTQPVEDGLVSYISDTSHGMQRVETRCNVCDAHLGHVFPDGPPPTGLRFCINGVSLRKVTSDAT